jgi:hypothetical protein
MLAQDADFIMGQEQRRSSGARLGWVDPSTDIMGQEVSPAAQLGLVAPDTPDAPATIEQPKSVFDQFVTSVTKAAAAILPLAQQQKVLNLQLKRAQAGLPPLNVGAYIDPNQGFNVGLGAGTQKTLLYLGGGLAAAWILTRVLKHR